METGVADDVLRQSLVVHKFTVDELMTKLRILSEEFDLVHRHDPVEHVTQRVKRPDAILDKHRRKGLPAEPALAAEHLYDAAGVRAVCPFVSDVYRVRDMPARQGDVEILKTKDHIATPKPNGYRSLHPIVRIPVFLSDRVEHVQVEVQLRTNAMDFWATLEHKLYYKYDDQVLATIAAELDARMESPYVEVQCD